MMLKGTCLAPLVVIFAGEAQASVLQRRAGHR